MAVTNYYSVGGRLLGEATSGAETTYMTDALGSNIGTVTSAGLRNRYTYKPYGGQLSKTGPDADPRCTWNARAGYRSTGRPYSEEYARRRQVSTSTCLWTACDPNWPAQLPYAYASGNPITLADPSGMGPKMTFKECWDLYYLKHIDDWKALCRYCAKVTGGAPIQCDDPNWLPPGWKWTQCPRTSPKENHSEDPYERIKEKAKEKAMDCAKKCAGEDLKELAKCIAKECGGDALKELGLGWVFCKLYPKICDQYGGEPCEHVRDIDSCQECVDEQEWECIISTPPSEWLKCYVNHRQGYQKCGGWHG